MTNALQLFNDEETSKIRTVEINSKLYFVGTDIAKILGCKYPHYTITRNCKEALKHIVVTDKGAYEMTVISESDVPRLIESFRVQIAKRSKRQIPEENPIRTQKQNKVVSAKRTVESKIQLKDKVKIPCPEGKYKIGTVVGIYNSYICYEVKYEGEAYKGCINLPILEEDKVQMIYS